MQHFDLVKDSCRNSQKLIITLNRAIKASKPSHVLVGQAGLLATRFFSFVVGDDIFLLISPLFLLVMVLRLLFIRCCRKKEGRVTQIVEGNYLCLI